jgi:hypothetical protein
VSADATRHLQKRKTVGYIHESLETIALISKTADSVKDGLQLLLTNGVVAWAGKGNGQIGCGREKNLEKRSALALSFQSSNKIRGGIDNF